MQYVHLPALKPVVMTKFAKGRAKFKNIFSSVKKKQKKTQKTQQFSQQYPGLEMFLYFLVWRHALLLLHLHLWLRPCLQEGFIPQKNCQRASLAWTKSQIV